VAVGANAVRTFTIRNAGGANLQVTDTSLTGTDPGQFAITSGGGAFTLASNATRDIEVRFSPTSGGTKSASLSLTSNDSDEGTFNVNLDGTGTTAPEIVVSPLSHNFGAQQLDTPVNQSFTVSNIGSSDLVVAAPTLSGDTGSFSITSGGSSTTIPPNRSTSIQVQFRTTTEGPKSATLTITSNDGDEGSVTVNLSGSGFVPGAAPPTFIEAQQGGSASSTSVTTNAALTGVSGHVYLAAVSTKSPRAVTAVTGLGLTWTRVAAQCGGRNQTAVEVWWAQGNATSGAVTATLASAPSNAVIAVARYSGASVVTPVALLVGGNSNGVNGACANGTDSAAYSFNLTTTQPNALVIGAIASRNHTHTPGAGYTERIEALQGTSSGSAVRITLVDRGVPSPLSLLFNGTLARTTDWAVLAVQLQP
jgi:VCBS repeat-containing protein